MPLFSPGVLAIPLVRGQQCGERYVNELPRINLETKDAQEPRTVFASIVGNPQPRWDALQDLPPFGKCAWEVPRSYKTRFPGLEN